MRADVNAGLEKQFRPFRPSLNGKIAGAMGGPSANSLAGELYPSIKSFSSFTISKFILF